MVTAANYVPVFAAQYVAHSIRRILLAAILFNGAVAASFSTLGELLLLLSVCAELEPVAVCAYPRLPGTPVASLLHGRSFGFLSC
jgi:hypothetical protein